MRSSGRHRSLLRATLRRPALFAAPVATSLVIGAACASPERERLVVTQAEAQPQRIVLGLPEATVRELWGEPARTLTYTDEKTGRVRAVWQFDRFVDTNGSRVLTSVTFVEGRAVDIERTALPQPVLPGAPDAPRDSAARRDMER